ncbi:vacuolar protein sorting-associated protein VTA1 homolog [Bolinopsis microptera]|uniref:vacuolar protein sorting-associated protein VTA1 homolog n=1 Tax=Bolinopsis microptera TaxID=2820187 RepID=UPI00307A65FC
MDVPGSLKSLAPYLRLCKQFESRDPVVAYHCQLYFVQKGIQLCSSDAEGKMFLLGIMDKLEQAKSNLIAQQNEAVGNDIVASSHIESKALQLFLFADREDRAGNFDVKVIKTFYTASLLFELLTLFDALNEENAYQKKYAQWKATYLERCRRSGEEPVAGPALHDQEQAEAEADYNEQPGASGIDAQPTFNQPEQPAQPTYHQPEQPTYNPPAQPTYNPPPQPKYNPPAQPTYNPPAQPTYNPPAQPTYNPPAQPSYNPPAPAAASQPSATGVTTLGSGELLRLDTTQFQNLDYQQIERIQKLCRFAGSALNYKDYKTTLDNLQKAINLIRVGQEE